jgi:hypothetical protein
LRIASARHKTHMHGVRHACRSDAVFPAVHRARHALCCVMRSYMSALLTSSQSQTAAASWYRSRDETVVVDISLACN